MISIGRENPRQAEVLELLRESDALMASLYPSESNHMLDVTALAAPEVAFYVARENGRALGCGAWVRTGAHAAELKRMFVAPSARGRKVGRRILETLETDAANAGVRVFNLETGVKQPEALGLYRTHGYEVCPPFEPYAPDPLSVFMTKSI